MNNRNRGLLLVVLTLGAFWPVFSSTFVVYDDPLYVTDAVFVRQGLSWSNIGWALTTLDAANWHPLMWLSLMLDSSIYGLNPAGFHATNLFLHIGNTLLLFGLLNRFSSASGWKSFVVALLFAIHPLHVESVAWIAERKDVLFTAFGLLALHAYVSYARGSRRAYWFTILFLILSLMSKSMLVTFPFLLLVLDYWPLCRVSQTPTRSWRQLVLEKWVMFVVIVGVTTVAGWAQSKAGATSSLNHLSLPIRAANAVTAYGLYLRDMIWPAKLSVIYLHPQEGTSFVLAGGVLVLLLTLTVLLFRSRQRIPAGWVGWCWYLGTLVPVIGIVQLGAQQRADRYTYFPMIGLFFGIVWCVSEFIPASGWRRSVTRLVTVLALAGLMVMTHSQVGHWKTSEALFRHALEIEPNNHLAHHNLGFALEKSGDIETAMTHYRQTLTLQPNFIGAQLSLAYALYETASTPNPGGPSPITQQNEAMNLVKSILNVDPKHALACNLKGNILRAMGRREEAVKSLEIALEGRPNNVTIRSNLAVTLFELGKRKEAQGHFDEGLRLEPNNPTLLLNLGVVEFQLGNMSKAIEYFEQADRAAPDRPRAKAFHASARMTLGAQFMQKGKYSEAIEEFGRSEELGSRAWQLQVNFGEAWLQLDQPKMAEKRFLAALELHQECVEAHFGLGRLYANMKRRDKAIEHLTAALKLRPDFQPALELLNVLKRSTE